MTITPFILGRGMAGQAFQKSLAILALQHPDWDVQETLPLSRNQKPEISSKTPNPVLFIANPHGLHASSILEGEKAGFKAILVEKPACVNLKEIESLKSVRIPVAVCHGYHQMWGPQTLKQMLDAGEFGELISIEGHYWQSSAAQKALEPSPKPHPWKNDPDLSGGSDALIDIGIHWADTAAFLMGDLTFKGTAWLSYANAEAPHRDTHVHLNLEFSGGRRALGSISKTFHGAANDFEVTLIGTRQSAAWNFMEPDGIWLGRGGSRTFLPRKESILGSGQPPFHALGWLEGYIEITRRLLLELQGQGGGNYPRLEDNLKVLESLFKLETIRQKK
jgi:predicted dehydrogenase